MNVNFDQLRHIPILTATLIYHHFYTETTPFVSVNKRTSNKVKW